MEGVLPSACAGGDAHPASARLLATKPVSAWRLPPPEQKAERQDQDQWQEENVPARRQEDSDGNRDSDEQELHG